MASRIKENIRPWVPPKVLDLWRKSRGTAAGRSRGRGGTVGLPAPRVLAAHGHVSRVRPAQRPLERRHRPVADVVAVT